MTAEIDPRLEDIPEDSSAEAASLKKKKTLVAMLSVGLVVAILTQPKSESDHVATDLEPNSAGKPSAIAKTADPDEPAESDESRIDRLSHIKELERIEFDEILTVELFAPEPRRLRHGRRDVVQRVNAIYGDSTERSALVGQSIVRRGQPLPDGGKVLQVNLDGIQVGL